MAPPWLGNCLQTLTSCSVCQSVQVWVNLYQLSQAYHIKPVNLVSALIFLFFFYQIMVQFRRVDHIRPNSFEALSSCALSWCATDKRDILDMYKNFVLILMISLHVTCYCSHIVVLLSFLPTWVCYLYHVNILLLKAKPSRLKVIVVKIIYENFRFFFLSWKQKNTHRHLQLQLQVLICFNAAVCSFRARGSI